MGCNFKKVSPRELKFKRHRKGAYDIVVGNKRIGYIDRLRVDPPIWELRIRGSCERNWPTQSSIHESLAHAKGRVTWLSSCGYVRVYRESKGRRSAENTAGVARTC